MSLLGKLFGKKEPAHNAPAQPADESRDAAPGERPAMSLLLASPPECRETVVSGTPTPELISSTVQSQPWKELTFVILQVDERNWIEVSGSLAPGVGLSARYMQKGKEYVSARPPASLREGEALLLSYLAGDDRWRTMIAWE